MNNTICKKLIPFLVLVSILFGSCQQKSTQPTNPDPTAFAKEIEYSISKGKGGMLDSAFDKKVFIEKMNLPDLPYASVYANKSANNINFGTDIARTITDQDNFAFIRHYLKDDKHHILFRLYNSSQRYLNYYDLELLMGNGKWKVADVYVYLAGETLATTYGNLFNALFDKPGEGNMGPRVMKKTDVIEKIKLQMDSGNTEEAIKLYDVLPEDFRRQKNVMLMNIHLCSYLSDEAYDKAIRAYSAAFPNEPNMNLLTVDGYFLQKDYKKMLDAVNALDSQINKDPLLDLYRYQAYYQLKDNYNAKVRLARLVQDMPDFQTGYRELIAIDLEEKNKAGADSIIAVYRKKKFNEEELKNTIDDFK